MRLSTPLPIRTIVVALCSCFVSNLMADPDVEVLSGFEDPLADEWTGNESHQFPLHVEFDAELVKEGGNSAKWVIDTSPWLRLREVPGDWSRAFALAVWIYSDEARGQDINIVVEAQDANAQPVYFLHQTPVDWEGWNEVVIPLTDFRSSVGNLPWENVTGFRLTAEGWNANRVPGAVLYLDDLKLIH